MTLQGWLQIVVFFAIIVAITPLLGSYMARVYTGKRVALARAMGPIERGIYRSIRVDPQREQDWKSYAASLLLFSLAGWLLLYLIPVSYTHLRRTPPIMQQPPRDASVSIPSNLTSALVAKRACGSARAGVLLLVHCASD